MRDGMDVEELVDPLLAQFLEETRLRSETQVPPRATEPGPRPEMHQRWLALAEVLSVGYGERAGAVITKGRTLMRARTTPSAGALYPFDVLVAFQSTAGYRIYHYDAADCCLHSPFPVGDQDLAALLGMPQAWERMPAAVVAVVGRPWKSMRKYGRRGYRYTHLDGGHAAANIALAAADAGFTPAVHLRFDRHRAARLFAVDGRCREPQALVALSAPAGGQTWQGADGAGHANPFAVPVWRHEGDAGSERPDAAECDNWLDISSISTYGGESSPPPHWGTVRSVTCADEATDTADDILLPGADTAPTPPFPQVAVERTSAKGFLPGALDRASLGRALAGLRGSLAVDSADGPLVGLRVLARTVEGIAPGSYAYVPQTHALSPRGGDGASSESVAAACVNQDVVRDAAVLIALHAPMRALRGRHGRQGLAELHFHAAAAAQRICLGGCAHDVGVTCLGGFDAERIAELTMLNSSEEVIYVLAAGVPDASAVKWDRAPIAYSHGARRTSGAPEQIRGEESVVVPR
ncbi:nitroreductase family protein [Streptomyces fagopyri]|uniref:nitroreductase family protein n=1 Tax=Streptomyces fagopyri TaxID=2662397 RepID=UPI001885A48F|nr:nitroreductase family protein [Streptomyces fagopyri]